MMNRYFQQSINNPIVGGPLSPDLGVTDVTGVTEITSAVFPRLLFGKKIASEHRIGGCIAVRRREPDTKANWEEKRRLRSQLHMRVTYSSSQVQVVFLRAVS
jgi:hypothetical protein